MRIKMGLLLILAMLLLTGGCTERQRQDISHWKSDLVGLDRVVTLYSVNGQPIKTWKGRFKVEVTGSTARFLNDDGKAVIISGTFLIEEK